MHEYQPQTQARVGRDQIIDLTGLCTPSAIYRTVVPQLQRLYRGDPDHFDDTRFIWDFQGLEPRRINTMALCLFLGLAHTLKRRVRHQPEALFIWKPEVNHFLNHCGFFDTVRALKLFTIPEEQTGIGVDVGPPPRAATKLFWFPPCRSVTDALPDYESLREQRLQLGDQLQDALYHQRVVLESTLGDEVARNAINCIVELCVNACVYSCGTVFGMVQISSGTVSISLVDNGIGLHAGLLRMKTSGDPSFRDGLLWHSWDDFSKLPALRRDLAAILEATCTKPTSGEPGIWDVLQYVLTQVGGLGKIHTANATLEFDSELLAALNHARIKLRDAGTKEDFCNIETALINGKTPRGRFYAVPSRGTHFDLKFTVTRRMRDVGSG